MKALVCHAFGPLQNLEWKETSVPVPAANEVLIRVAYAGVNFPDALIVQGKYQFKPQLPFVPGGECSGEVVEVGSEVTRFRPGDQVLAAMGWGAFGEFAISMESNTFRIPDGIGTESASILPETYGTAYYALKDRGEAREGETLVVLGAAGGTGTAAIQVGKQLGMKVIAVVSSRSKLEFCLNNGADMGLNYLEQDLKETLKKSGGADLIFDPVGGAASEAAFRSLRPGGRHLVVGFASGEIPALPWNLPLLKSASIVGVFWGHFWRNQPEENRRNMEKLLQWLGEGRVRPVITKRYPMAAAVEALQELTNRKATGKIVLSV